jgi:hypothetical protein
MTLRQSAKITSVIEESPNTRVGGHGEPGHGQRERLASTDRATGECA